MPFDPGLGGLLGTVTTSGLLGGDDEHTRRLMEAALNHPDPETRRRFELASRVRQRNPDLDRPTALESIGRGMTDAYQPLVQGYYNALAPERAAAYRAHRAEDEALYREGLLAGGKNWRKGDFWREQGRSLLGGELLRPFGFFR